MSLTIDLWGSQLPDYVSSIDIFLGKDIWRDTIDIPINVVHRDALQQVFLEREVFLSNKKDTLFWATAKDGRYTIKEWD